MRLKYIIKMISEGEKYIYVCAAIDRLDSKDREMHMDFLDL